MNHTEVFFSIKKVSYSLETKYKTIEMKKAAYTIKEIKELKLDNNRKDIEIDIKKVQRIGKGVVPTVIVELVDQLKHKYSVKMILDVLEIPKSIYYRWKHKNYKNDDLTEKVIQLSSVAVNHKRVQKIMQKNNVNCRVRPKKSKSIGKPYYKTDNLVQRQFKTSQPMKVLTTAITYLPIWSFYVVFIFDNGYL